MMDLAIRKTHSYVGTYSDLDDWDSIGSFEVVSSTSEVKDEQDASEPTSITLIAKVDSNAEDADITQALKASLSNVGCHHEYDCCGCASTRVDDVSKQDDGFWKITQTATRNY